MHTLPTPLAALSAATLRAVAKLRAEGLPWPTIAEELALPLELHPDLDLLPFFHPDWPALYRHANRQCEREAFAEAQLVTRRLMRSAEKPALRAAARRRVAPKPNRSKSASPDTFAVRPGSALELRLARGETLESIAATYLAGLDRR